MRNTLIFASVALMSLSGAAFAQSTANPPATQTPDAAQKAPAMKPTEGRASSTDNDNMAKKQAPQGDNNGNNRTGGNGN